MTVSLMEAYEAAYSANLKATADAILAQATADESAIRLAAAEGELTKNLKEEMAMCRLRAQGAL